MYKAGRWERAGESPSTVFRAVFPGYFQTMRIPVLRGRDVTENDNFNKPDVVVINEYMARHHWPGEDPIGKQITFDDPTKNPSWATVVGVVKNTVRGPGQSSRRRSICSLFAVSLLSAKSIGCYPRI